jgi:hypothetical protein
MTLYHGSYKAVETPDLSLSRKNLDFGAGFYTTVNRDQAVDFARKVAIRKGQTNSFVSIYTFDLDVNEPRLNVLRFQAPEKLWLDFVHHNRHGTYTGGNYDLIIGPVANDDVFATLLVYEQGILNVEQTLEALKVKNLYSQFVFKTNKALAFLRFAGAFSPEDLP